MGSVFFLKISGRFYVSLVLIYALEEFSGKGEPGVFHCGKVLITNTVSLLGMKLFTFSTFSCIIILSGVF